MWVHHLAHISPLFPMKHVRTQLSIPQVPPARSSSAAIPLALIRTTLTNPAPSFTAIAPADHSASKVQSAAKVLNHLYSHPLQNGLKSIKLPSLHRRNICLYWVLTQNLSSLLSMVLYICSQWNVIARSSSGLPLYCMKTHITIHLAQPFTKFRCRQNDSLPVHELPHRLIHDKRFFFVQTLLFLPLAEIGKG